MVPWDIRVRWRGGLAGRRDDRLDRGELGVERAPHVADVVRATVELGPGGLRDQLVDRLHLLGRVAVRGVDGRGVEQRVAVRASPRGERGLRLLREQRAPGEHLVGERPEREDVRRRAHLRVAGHVLLGRRVADRHRDHAGVRGVVLHPDDAEVGDLGDLLARGARDEHVGRLEVAVDQALGVDVAERAGDVAEDAARTLRREPLAGLAERAMDAVVQRGAVRSAVDVLEDEVADGDDVVVEDVGGDPLGDLHLDLALVEEADDVRARRAPVGEPPQARGLRAGRPSRRPPTGPVRAAARSPWRPRARRRVHRSRRARRPCRRRPGAPR